MSPKETKAPDLFVVDDDELARKMYKTLFKVTDYDVVYFSNAQTALEALIENPNNTPRLVLLDLSMPVLNGDEFMIKVSEQKIINEFIAVLVTGHNLDAAQEFRLQTLGVQRVLYKKNILNTLIDVVAEELATANTDI